MRALVETASALADRLRRPRVWQLAREMRDRQWWSSPRLREVREERLRSLVRHAGHHVPYYRELFEDTGIDAEHFGISTDWARIPILEKETLRARFDALVSRTDHSLEAPRNASGGSTGQPVSFLSDLALYQVMDAFLYVCFSWAGWKPGERCLHLWGGTETPRHPGLRHRLKGWLSGRIVFPVYSYGEEAFARWLSRIRRSRPTIIYAYPSVAAAFAQWLEAEGHRMEGLKGIFCSAEVLLPAQRAVMERAFGVRVFNQYGCREAPAVACECPEGSLHIFEDCNHVEFVDATDAGKRVVVTPLWNYAQPLLRYDLGDLGEPVDGPCPCGRGYPRMKLAVGRRNDHLLSLDGGHVYPSFFIHLLDGKEWIRHFQIRQESRDRVVFILEEAAPGAFERERAGLKAELLPALEQRMGGPVSLELVLTPSIDRTRSGKFRYVVNALEEAQ